MMDIQKIIDELDLGDLAIRRETWFGRGRSHMWMRKLTRQEHQHYMYLLYDFFDGSGYNYDSGVSELNDRIEEEYLLLRDSMNLFYRVHSPFLIENVPEPIRMIPNKNRNKFF